MVLALVLASTWPVYAGALSTRARGMGGAFIGVCDDETAVYLNPAGLSQIQGREGALQLKVNERDSFNWNSAAFTGHIYEDAPQDQFSITDYLEHNLIKEPLPRRPKYSYGVAYTEDDRSEAFGAQVGGEFLGVHRKERDLKLAFGTRFPVARRMMARESLYFGVKFDFNWVDRNIKKLGTTNSRESDSMGLAFMYHYNDRITGGLVIDNVIERVRGAAAQTDGTTLSLGGKLLLTKDVIVAADATNVTSSSKAESQQYRVGLEKKFVDNDLTLRMGAWNGTLTLGFGMQILPQIRFDYAFYNGDVIKEHYVAGHVTFD